MKKFRFQLEGALKLRLQQEDAWMAEVHKKQDRLRQEEKVLEELQIQMERVLAESATPVGQRIDVEHRQWALLFVDSLLERQSRQRIRIDQAEKDLEQARTGLLAIRKQRLMLEKLRDKQLAEYQRMELREEQKLLDEMANYGYFRNQAQEG